MPNYTKCSLKNIPQKPDTLLVFCIFQVMNQYEKNDKISVYKEQEPFMITFFYQQEAELYRIRKKFVKN
jgi:hypothetical protein